LCQTPVCSSRIKDRARSDQTVGTIASNLHAVGLIAITLAFAAAGRVLVGNQSPASLEEFGRMRIYAIALCSFCVFSGRAIRLCCRVEADTGSRDAHARSSRRARNRWAAIILPSGLAAPINRLSDHNELARKTRLKHTIEPTWLNNALPFNVSNGDFSST
jgi:hypothetical protein